MNETERKSYEARVEHAMADPDIAARLVRGLAAVETLVCGRPGSPAAPTEPVFMVGMRLTREELDLLMVAPARDGRDCMYLAYDLDDLEAVPAIAVLRPDRGDVVIDLGCRLWIGTGRQRAVIVTANHVGGSYAFRSGSSLTHAANSPASDLGAGTTRANSRMRRLAATGLASREIEHAARIVTRSRDDGALQISRARLAA